ncbi:hypothetical protein [Sulfitobacter sp. SK011]|uniref:hypothetical protein n=1 Tax=Sulfitobacter sp. SK011 TaxID=1389004 RepID=UPI000E0AD8D1|nr:hypothetical protein [Sulfitobacter sp. SK011]AXI43978.1 hypothetical protein C1J02_20195 [Sulfitobacter sp. SK011]
MMITPDLFAELLTRAIATAVIVVGITITVERVGPAIGGALGGLPIVIGPGFYFLIQEQSTTFTISAATSSLIALTASQAFLIGYVAIARRSQAAIVIASLCWLLAALILADVPQSPWIGLVLFLTATGTARFVANRFQRPYTRTHARGGLTALLARGVAAGLLVAFVTVAAEKLGPVSAGFLMTYPIAMTVIAITVHQRSGADVVIATLRSIMYGIGSLAAFTFTLAVTLVPFGSVWTFVASLVAGVAVTFSLTLRSARLI